MRTSAGPQLAASCTTIDRAIDRGSLCRAAHGQPAGGSDLGNQRKIGDRAEARGRAADTTAAVEARGPGDAAESNRYFETVDM